MYKVFLREKVIWFSTPEQAHNTGDNVIHEPSMHDIQRILNTINDKVSGSDFFFTATDAEKLFINFCTAMKKIAAAGGIIFNERNEFLFIFRRGRWDLPKGKIDSGETEEQAALREVSEETGLTDHCILKRLSSSLHLYTIGDQWVLKETYWFLMQSNSHNTLIPQAEEGITQIEWIAPGQINAMSEKLFHSLRDVLAEAIAQHACLLKKQS